jgi:hypothetical protein
MPESPDKFPAIKHLYQNWGMDSLRWNFFKPRGDDIVVATTYKAGTTWAQVIVANLIFAGKLPASIAELSPWIEQRINPLELVLTRVENQSHRRVLAARSFIIRKRGGTIVTCRTFCWCTSRTCWQILRLR